MCRNPLVLEAVSTALDSVGDAAEASVALYDGNYRKAASELTALGAPVLGYGGVGRSQIPRGFRRQQ